MTGERDDNVFLWEMLQAARDVVRFVEGQTYEDYLRDPMRRMAVERGVQIIGEAARLVSEDCRTQHPEIAWRGIIGQRHRVTHEYYGLDHSRVWEVAVEHVPTLIQQLEAIVPTQRDDSPGSSP